MVSGKWGTQVLPGGVRQRVGAFCHGTAGAAATAHHTGIAPVLRDSGVKPPPAPKSVQKLIAYSTQLLRADYSALAGDAERVPWGRVENGLAMLGPAPQTACSMLTEVAEDLLEMQ
eukprot:gnl/Dysnectes_brevis/34530_a505110_12.p3 GENE.gnl/Dysnectes_brevis/34530_a505110_12~~gnl/Dysnectes_brevis/34530_a505110_12.p3  ORF type:complete len:116 (-),score=40.41 gnl/Dysnectes_brevis/34530_a505110_12:64-411(-)